MTDHELLRRAAQRAAERPFFLASALLRYARAEGLADDALAERLGCAPADLPALLLCRRPRGEVGQFRMDVQRIADRFKLDAARLARTIRLADALAAFDDPAANTAPGLMAARDRADSKEPPSQRPPRHPSDPAPESEDA